MKLYNCRKRLAKKYGVFRREFKLDPARHLKPGDIIATCSGHNQRIAEIVPVVRNIGSRSYVIVDFDIETTDGSGHSWIHCCGPAESPAQIEEYYRSWDHEEGHKIIREFKWDYFWKILAALKEGKPICDQDGFIFPEFK